MKLILILSFVTALMFTSCGTDATTTEPTDAVTDTTTVTTPEVQNENASVSTDTTASPVVETPSN